MAITRRILLKRNTSNSVKRLIVTAEDIDGSVSPYLFKFYRKPLNPLDNSGIRDIFIAVCTAADMQDLPIVAPDEDSSGYFRSNIVDLTFLTVAETEAAWEDIEAGVEALIAEIKALDNLGIESQLIVGDQVFLQFRTYILDTLIKKNGALIQYYVNSVLKNTFTKIFGMEAAIGIYTENFLTHTLDQLLKATKTLNFDCRANFSKTYVLTFTTYADVGRFVKSYLTEAILKGTITKTFNTNSVLKTQLTLSYGVDARLL